MGEWVQADSGKTIDVTNPATGLKIGAVEFRRGRNTPCGRRYVGSSQTARISGMGTAMIKAESLNVSLATMQRGFDRTPARRKADRGGNSRPQAAISEQHKT